jgi:hypothetical protein
MNIKQEDSLLGSSSPTVFVGYWVGVSVLVIVVLGRLPFSSILLVQSLTTEEPRLRELTCGPFMSPLLANSFQPLSALVCFLRSCFRLILAVCYMNKGVLVITWSLAMRHE